MEKKSIYQAKTGGWGWGWWDKTVEAGSLVAATTLVPFVALRRSIGRIGQRSRLAELRDEYEKSRYGLQLASRTPVEFLSLYLKRLHEVRQCFLSTRWGSLEEATAGYELMKAAEAALLIQAQAEVKRLGVNVSLMAGGSH